MVIIIVLFLSGQLKMYINVGETVLQRRMEQEKRKLEDEIELKLLKLMSECLDKITSAVSPDEEEREMKSLEFFRKQRIAVKSLKIGSVIWTLDFMSLSSLRAFWSAYNSGELREMVQQDYITDTFLKEFELESLHIDIHVKETDFQTCKEELQGKFSATFPPNYKLHQYKYCPF